MCRGAHDALGAAPEKAATNVSYNHRARDCPPNRRPSVSSRRITSSEDDRRPDIAQPFSRVRGCPFAPSVPQRRVSGTRVFFGITSPLWSRTATGAPCCREMYTTTKEHFSNRTLKKATNANYVCRRESSIKTITRKNFGRVPTSPTLLPQTKEQVAGFYRTRRDPLLSLVPLLRATSVVT
jgi:hypothetical protein